MVGRGADDRDQIGFANSGSEDRSANLKCKAQKKGVRPCGQVSNKLSLLCQLDRTGFHGTGTTLGAQK
jgi:hypothetical protein